MDLAMDNESIEGMRERSACLKLAGRWERSMTHG